MRLPRPPGRDAILEAAGCAGVFAGLWWLYPPVALITAGLAAIVVANGIIQRPRT